jgi:hypothetical protein
LDTPVNRDDELARLKGELYSSELRFASCLVSALAFFCVGFLALSQGFSAAGVFAGSVGLAICVVGFRYWLAFARTSLRIRELRRHEV